MQKNVEDTNVTVKSFAGARIADMKDYVRPSLEKKPDMIILHVGTNDLRSSNNEQTIAREIMQLAEGIMNDDIEVTVSGLLRRGDNQGTKVDKVNSYIRDFCVSKNLRFIQHSNIDPRKHLFRGKLHPSKFGATFFSKKFCNFLNT